MDRNNLLKWIRDDGSAVVERFLPSGAEAELDGVISARRHDVNTQEFLMFMSIRALLRSDGLQSVESDREAGQIMALLKL